MPGIVVTTFYRNENDDHSRGRAGFGVSGKKVNCSEVRRTRICILTACMYAQKCLENITFFTRRVLSWASRSSSTTTRVARTT